MNSIIHILSEARNYAEEDLKIAQGIGIYEDVVDALDMLHIIGEAQATVWADDWNDGTLDAVLTALRFVNDHRTI